MGTKAIQTKLPDPTNQSIVSIPERKKRMRHVQEELKKQTANKVTESIELEKTTNFFSEISLKNTSAINQALARIKVPKNMPTNPEPLIAEIIKQDREEKQADRMDYFPMHSRDVSTIKFHGRFGITPTKSALIVTNTLLKAFNKAGASVTLTEEKDIMVTLEGAILTISCHIPSHKILLKPNDKRWTQWADTAYEPTDEKVCYNVKLQHSWNTNLIHHKEKEDASDYVKRIFIKAIRLIPNSRKIVHDDQLQEIKREEEEKKQEERRKQHDEAYSNLKELLKKAQAHQVAKLLRSYIQDTDFKNKETLALALHLTKWLDGQESSDILSEFDRSQLISEFFKSNDHYNPFHI